MAQERHAETTRKRILEAARSEFVSKGLAGARVDEIALQSGSNKRMIYQYYGNKEGLYAAVLQAADTDLAGVFPPVEEMTPVEAVQSASRALIDYCAAHPDYVALMLWEAALGWTTYEHLPSRATDTATARLVRSVKRGIEAGVFRAELDPFLAVNAAIAQVIMYSSISTRLPHRSETRPDLGAVQAGLTDLFLHSLTN